MVLEVLCGIQFVAIGIGTSLWYLHYRKNKNCKDGYDAGTFDNKLEHAMEKMEGIVNCIEGIQSTLPKKVLNTIQGSINSNSGKVGELVTMLKMMSEYDRIIPLGQPVDMIGVSQENIDFIECKTNNGRLTDMEKHIRTLINDNKVRFILAQMDINIDTPVGEEE